MSIRGVAALIAILIAIAQGGCAPISPAAENALAFEPAPAKYTWMLPKTVLSVSASYMLTECTGTKWTVKPTVQITNLSAPDTTLGPDFPNGIVSLMPTEYKSFWQDSDITVQTNSSTHILSELSSKPTNETGTIISTIAGGVVNLAAVGLGVQTVKGAEAPNLCGAAQDLLKQIKADQDTLSNPKATADEIKNAQARIAANQAALTITVQKTIDPGAAPRVINALTHHAYIGGIAPTDQQLKDSKWFSANTKLANLDGRDQFILNMYFDLNKAYPLTAISQNVACDNRHRCALAPAVSPKGTLFREVAYIPVLASQATKPNIVLFNTTFPFGQYGIPRALPLTAGLFEKLSWDLTFADTGELTKATFTSQATGLGLSSLFGNLASSASSIATESRNAAVAVDPATTRLQNENNALKAQIDNINYTQQLNALLAAGGH